jgi:ATP-dependent DNA helicase RecQ
MSVTQGNNDEWICSTCTLSNSKSQNRCNACLSQKGPLSYRPPQNTNTTKSYTIDLTGEDHSDSDDDDVQVVPASTLSARKRRTMNQSQISEAQHDVEQIKGKVQKTLFGNSIDPVSILKEKKRASSDVPKKRKRNQTGNSTDSKHCDLSLDAESSNDMLFSDTKYHHIDENHVKAQEIQMHNSTLGSNNLNYMHLYNKAMKTLSSTFGISSLRNLQPKAVECALRGQSQIIIMATGGGKSLCYQLPAVVLPGISIVVCPLIALMVDQVHSLKRKGIEAAFISSSQSEKENQLVIERLQGITSKTQAEKEKLNFAPPVHKPIKLLYCTPELLQTNRFRNILTNLYQHNKLSLLAIDEAHCVSTWGSDFRPAYRNLAWLRDSFPAMPCMACTATATKKVIDDIRSVLRMTNGEVCHKSTFNRENIHYEVRYKDSLGGDNLALQDVMKIVKAEHEKADQSNTPCSGIIYVHKRQDTAHIASMLTNIGIPAASYHAGKCFFCMNIV